MVLLCYSSAMLCDGKMLELGGGGGSPQFMYPTSVILPRLISLQI
jgi:hypothetical protein